MTLPELIYDVRSYNFSITSGFGVSANLTASGAGKVVTFTRLPFGFITGSVMTARISGGTGTAEVVSVSSVSGTEGAAGSITVTTVNSHTGPWVISSATGGMQEAHNAAPDSGCTIKLANGNVDIYAQTTISKTIAIVGNVWSNANGAPSATGNSTITPQTAGQNVFKLTGTVFGVTFFNFTVAYTSAQSGGTVFWLENAVQTVIHYTRIYNAWNAVDATTSWGVDVIDHNIFDQFQSVAIAVGNRVADATGGYITFNQFTSPNTALSAITNSRAGALDICNNGFHHIGQYAIITEMTNVTSQLFIRGNSFDGQGVNPIYIGDSSGVTLNSIIISDNTFGNWNSVGAVWEAINITSGSAQAVTISGNVFHTEARPNALIGVAANGRNIVIQGNVFEGPFTGAIQSQYGVNVMIGPNVIDGAVVRVQQYGTPSNTMLQNPSPMAYSEIAALTNAAGGSQIYCTDGNVTSPSDNTLTSGGTGALAVMIAGVWRAFKAQN